LSLYYFTVYLLQIKEKKDDWRSLILGAVYLSFTVLIRPAVMYLPFALLAGFIFLLLLFKKPEKILPMAVIILVIIVLPMGGWSLRNAVKTDFAGYSAIASIQLYAYNAGAVYARQQGIDYYEAIDFLLAEEDEELHKYMAVMPKYEAYTERAMEIIRSDFPAYVKFCAIGVACLFFYPGVNDILAFTGVSTQAITQAKDIINSYGISIAGVTAFFASSGNTLYALALLLNIFILILLSLLAFIGTIKANLKEWYIKAMYLGILLYMVLVSCQPFGYGAYPRYRLGFSMILILFAAFGVDKISLKKSPK
jgi:hypothetical protein